MATLVQLGALDTKGDEYAVIRDRVIEAGCDVLMINAGVLGDPDYPIAFSRADVATEAGSDIETLVAAGDSGAAVTAMADGAASRWIPTSTTRPSLKPWRTASTSTIEHGRQISPGRRQRRNIAS